MPDTWTAEQSLLVSKYATEAGRWRSMAEGLARYIRSDLKSDQERDWLLAAFDELRAQSDGTSE
jgi:hypothetical protein